MEKYIEISVHDAETDKRLGSGVFPIFDASDREKFERDVRTAESAVRSLAHFLCYGDLPADALPIAAGQTKENEGE